MKRFSLKSGIFTIYMSFFLGSSLAVAAQLQQAEEGILLHVNPQQPPQPITTRPSWCTCMSNCMRITRGTPAERTALLGRQVPVLANRPAYIHYPTTLFTYDPEAHQYSYNLPLRDEQLVLSESAMKGIEAMDHFPHSVFNWRFFEGIPRKILYSLSLPHMTKEEGFIPGWHNGWVHGRSIGLKQDRHQRLIKAAEGFYDGLEMGFGKTLDWTITGFIGYQIFAKAQTLGDIISIYKNEGTKQTAIADIIYVLLNPKYEQYFAWTFFVPAVVGTISSVKAIWQGATSGKTEQGEIHKATSVLQSLYPLPTEEVSFILPQPKGKAQIAKEWIWDKTLTWLTLGSRPNAVSTIVESSLWDRYNFNHRGSVPYEDKRHAFNALVRLAQEGKGYDKLYTLHALGYIAQGVSLKDFSRYPDEEQMYLRYQLYFRAKALEILQQQAGTEFILSHKIPSRSQVEAFLASLIHGQTWTTLGHTTRDFMHSLRQQQTWETLGHNTRQAIVSLGNRKTWQPVSYMLLTLPRELYARYQLWNIGHPSSLTTHAGSLGIKAFAWYLRITFLKEFIEGLDEYLSCPERPYFSFTGYKPEAYQFSEACFDNLVSLYNTLIPGQPAYTVTDLISQYNFPDGTYNLDLSNKNVTAQQIADMLYGFNQSGIKLTGLNISNNHLGYESEEALIQLANNFTYAPFLEIFDASGNDGAGTSDPKLFGPLIKSLDFVLDLQELYLNSLLVNFTGFSKILPNLQVLDMGNSYYDASTASFDPIIKASYNLKKLILPYTSVNNPSISTSISDIIQEVAQLWLLEELDFNNILAGCSPNFSCANIANTKLINLINLKKLTFSLSDSGYDIGDFVCKLPLLESLKLDLDYFQNWVTCNTHINSLEVSTLTNINNQSIFFQEFAQMPSLKSLILSGFSDTNGFINFLENPNLKLDFLGILRGNGLLEFNTTYMSEVGKLLGKIQNFVYESQWPDCTYIHGDFVKNYQTAIDALNNGIISSGHNPIFLPLEVNPYMFMKCDYCVLFNTAEWLESIPLLQTSLELGSPFSELFCEVSSHLPPYITRLNQLQLEIFNATMNKLNAFTHLTYLSLDAPMLPPNFTNFYSNLNQLKNIKFFSPNVNYYTYPDLMTFCTNEHLETLMDYGNLIAQLEPAQIDFRLSLFDSLSNSMGIPMYKSCVEGFSYIMNALPANLEKLNFGGLTIYYPEEFKSFIKTLYRFNNLKTLNIGDASLPFYLSHLYPDTYDPQPFYEAIGNFSRLQSLYFGGCFPSVSNQTNFLLQLKQLNLKELTLNNLYICDSDIPTNWINIPFLAEAIQEMKELRKFSIISREYNIGNNNSNVLLLAYALRNKPFMEELDLSNNNLGIAGTEGMRELLTSIAQMPRLKSLNLYPAYNISWTDSADALRTIYMRSLDTACQQELCYGIPIILPTTENTSSEIVVSMGKDSSIHLLKDTSSSPLTDLPESIDDISSVYIETSWSATLSPSFISTAIVKPEIHTKRSEGWFMSLWNSFANYVLKAIVENVSPSSVPIISATPTHLPYAVIASGGTATALPISMMTTSALPTPS